MNRMGWMLVVGIVLGFFTGPDLIQSATRELADTDSAQTLSNKAGIIPTGGILSFGGSSSPSGYLLCDGSAVSRTTYAALFSALGTTYGTGDGSTTFNLPDLRGRSPLGSGTGSGLSARTNGQTGGEENHALSTDQMPTHSHVHAVPWYGSTVFTYSSSASSPVPIYRLTPHPDDGSGNASTNTTGGGGSHNVMDPFLVLNFIIKT